VIDEAHYIKNHRSKVAKAVRELNSRRRWCLTGTPIQNSLTDLYSIFQFLGIEPWDSLSWFQKLIQQPYEQGNNGALVLLQSILRPLLLRRTKETKYKDNKPIIVLPPVEKEMIRLSMSEGESKFYKMLHRRAKLKFDDYVKQGLVMHNYTNILELLLRLRQACNHPFLVLSGVDKSKWGLDEKSNAVMTGSQVMDSLGNEGDNALCVLETELTQLASPQSELSQVKHSTKITTIISRLEKTKSANEKSVLFTQWTGFLDLLEVALAQAEISFVRLDGSLSQSERQAILHKFKSGRIGVLLCSLKAAGVGLNLTNATNVIICDPWWNPAVEEQAIMRVHRLGQKSTVKVTRLIVKDSIEERMLQVQERKRLMCDGALGGSSDRATRLEDLQMLFGS